MDKLQSFNLDLDVVMEELKAALQQEQHLLSNYIRAIYEKIEHSDEKYVESYKKKLLNYPIPKIMICSYCSLKLYQGSTK